MGGASIDGGKETTDVCRRSLPVTTSSPAHRAAARPRAVASCLSLYCLSFALRSFVRRLLEQVFSLPGNALIQVFCRSFWTIARLCPTFVVHCHSPHRYLSIQLENSKQESISLHNPPRTCSSICVPIIEFRRSWPVVQCTKQEASGGEALL